MHFNTRYLKTSTKEWFGGGMDVTPCMPFDKESYHASLKQMCDMHNSDYYPTCRTATKLEV
jgi:coproporphyrinogen III oxidase